MGIYKNISLELKSFFASHHIFKILLPLDMIFLFGGVGILVLNQFVGVGGLLHTIAYYAFFLGLLLSYANFNQSFLYLGCFIYAGVQLLAIISGIFNTYRYLNYQAVLTALIFGYIGWLIFKGDSSVNKVS